MFIKSISFFISILLLSNLAIVNAQTTEDQIQDLLDSVYKRTPQSIGIMVHVEYPDKNISWTGAVGFSDQNKEKEILKNQPALIASNTKTYVATAILRLVEMKKIELDQPIKDLVTSKSEQLLSKDGYDLNKITIKHLLSHTSGINDYVNDDYFEFIDKHPTHKWKRDEQIELAIKVSDPLGLPSEKFKYADLNYLLLTEIIEKFAKKPFYTAIRDLIDYKKHKLASTWFIDLEKKPSKTEKLVHQYWNKYDWDSYLIDPSWDLYGGGGLVSTTKDLALFYQQLFDGEIIKNKEVLQLIHTDIESKEKSNYCLGIKKLSINNIPAYYHGGFWGTDVAYFPTIKATVAIFIIQKDKRALNGAINREILKILVKESPKK